MGYFYPIIFYAAVINSTLYKIQLICYNYFMRTFSLGAVL